MHRMHFKEFSEKARPPTWFCALSQEQNLKIRPCIEMSIYLLEVKFTEKESQMVN